MPFKHRGVEIEVDDNGYFNAVCDDVRIQESRLNDVKSQIDKVLANKPKRDLHLMCVVLLSDRYSSNNSSIVRRMELTGINRTSGEFRFSEPLPKDAKVGYCLPYTDRNHELLLGYADLLNKSRIMQADCEKLNVAINRWGRVDIDAYETVLCKVEDTYEAKRKLSLDIPESQPV